MARAKRKQAAVGPKDPKQIVTKGNKAPALQHAQCQKSRSKAPLRGAADVCWVGGREGPEALLFGCSVSGAPVYHVAGRLLSNTLHSGVMPFNTGWRAVVKPAAAGTEHLDPVMSCSGAAQLQLGQAGRKSWL